MQWLLGATQSLVNLIFFFAVVATLGVSIWLSRRYQQHFAEFPWQKAGLILAIEVIAWIAFNIFWSWVRAHLWITAIIVVIILFILFKRRQNQ